MLTNSVGQQGKHMNGVIVSIKWPQIQCVLFGALIPVSIIIDFRKKLFQGCKTLYKGQKEQAQMVSVYLTSASMPLTSVTQMEEAAVKTTENETEM